MKKLSTAAALLLVSALALAGCTASPEPAPEAASATPAAAQQVASLDADAAKAEAVAAGRPESAWDIECVAWEIPAADTESQAWANGLGKAWLSSHGAACPDQITFPGYYVESFAPGAKGELVAIIDNATYSSPEVVAMRIMDQLAEANPELAKVTARTQNGKFAGASTRADYDRARSVEAGTYVYP